jgi:hypothetical protein
VIVQRESTTAAWQDIAGMTRGYYVDAAVQAATRYRYRLCWGEQQTRKCGTPVLVTIGETVRNPRK